MSSPRSSACALTIVWRAATQAADGVGSAARRSKLPRAPTVLMCAVTEADATASAITHSAEPPAPILTSLRIEFIRSLNQWTRDRSAQVLITPSTLKTGTSVSRKERALYCAGVSTFVSVIIKVAVASAIRDPSSRFSTYADA